MKAIPLIFAAILALSVTPDAYACISTEQMISLLELQEQLNDLPNVTIEGNLLLNLVNTICNQSYSKVEFDSRLDSYDTIMDLRIDLVDEKIENIDLSGIDERVDNRVQNYTGWFEKQIDLDFDRQLLIAIYNKTVTEDESRGLNASDFMSMSYKASLEDRLDDIEGDIIDHTNRLNTGGYDVTGSTVAARYADYTWIYVVVVAAAVVLMFLSNANVRRRLFRARPPYTPPAFPAASLHAAPAGPVPAGVDEDDMVAAAKKGRMSSIFKKAKEDALERDSAKASKIDDTKKREEEFARIKREIDELSEDN